MPFIFDQDEEELKKQKEAGAQNISGQSSVISTPGAPQTKPGAVKSSGSWTNLQQYLDANKENASAMANNLSNKVESDAQKATDSINTYSNSKPAEVKKYSNDDLNNDFFNDPSKADKTVYTNLKNTGGYSGPRVNSEVSGYEDAQKNTASAVSKVNQMKSDEGRMQMFSDTYNRPNYTHGQKVFDNLLMTDNNAKGIFNDTQNKWANLQNVLDDANNNVTSRIETNKSTAFDNKNLIPGAEAAAVDNLYNPINTRATDFNTTNSDLNINNRIANYGSDSTDNRLSDDTVNFYGLGDYFTLTDKYGKPYADPNGGLSTMGLNLSNYLRPDYTDAVADNVATPEERAKWSALQALIDGTDNRITSDGKSINPLSFDKDAFLAERDRLKQEWAAASAGKNFVEQDRIAKAYHAWDQLWRQK